MAQATLRTRLGTLLALVAVVCLAFSGCDTGSYHNSTPSDPGTDPTPGSPFLTSVTPEDGCAGDIVTLNGFNFSPDLPQNIVTFSNQNGTISMQGTVLAFIDNGPDPNFGQNTALNVLVPTGVRTGSVSLTAPDLNGNPTAAGAAGFTGCPVVVGAALGATGLGGYMQIVGGTVTPGEVVFYGYNLSAVTSAQITDSTGNTEAATVMIGPPAGVDYTIPEGMTSTIVTFPAGLLLDCQGGLGASNVFVYELFAAGGTGNPIPANIVDIQMTASVDQGVPGAITGCLISSGIRRGDIAIHFNLIEEPASDKWDVIPQFLDPNTGNFVDCTLRPFVSPGPDGIPGNSDDETITNIADGTDLLPGLNLQESRIPGIIGPGQSYSMIWDSATDIPDTMSTTILRLQPSDPNPGTAIFCPSTIWDSEIIAIDNAAPDTGAVSENFSFNQFEDSTQSDAFWGPDLLVGNPVTSSGVPTGTGTVDVTLDPFGVYVLDTLTGEIVDETNPGLPVILLSTGNNPGSPLGEFHVRTLTINADAQLTIIGPGPVVIRASGTGDATEVAVRLNGDINIDGIDGTDGTANANGVGGDPGIGGGRGGDGGAVTVQANLFVESVLDPQSGENGGGQAGRSISYLRATGVTTARSGAGAGGGHQAGGGYGSRQSGSSTFALPGRGGPIRGDSANTEIVGGSGGGGGGAIPYRPSQTQPDVQVRNGGGGGGGGGAIEIAADGTVEINGEITAEGGEGGNGASPGGGAGGGGSGGTISVRATGNIALGPNALVLARGGEGGGTGTSFLGGDGRDGRIRLEANGAINLPGLVNFGNVEPPVGSPGVSVGLAASAIDGGDGSDGALNLVGFPAGIYLMDTETNTISDSGGGLVFASQPGFTPGVFNLASMDVPLGIVLRGLDSNLANGSNPLIIKVQGPATINGSIDVSGFDGLEADFTDPMNPLPGLAGIGGAGGGDGGVGGFDDGATAADGEDGGLPSGLPADLIGGIPPIGGGGGGQPVPPSSAVPATGGETLSITCGAGDSCVPGNGGGGGYALDGGDGSGGQAEDGVGGLAYGSDFFLNPNDGSALNVGGSGGAGGGGNSETPDGTAAHSPGTGGGGAGGFLKISVGGAFTVGFDAQLLSRGGDAFQAADRGGNGGGGAGGGIYVQGAGLMIFETGPSGEAPLVSVLGGEANLPSVGYAGNGSQNGGDGASGRIRIESPIGVNEDPPTNCNGNPTTGVCPPPSVASFLTANTVRSQAFSLPYPVVGAGTSVFIAPTAFDPAQITLVPVPQPQNTLVRLIVEGSNESLSVPGTAGDFTSGVTDPAILNGSEFIRLKWYLYSDASTGGIPSVDSVTIPVAVDSP